MSKEPLNIQLQHFLEQEYNKTYRKIGFRPQNEEEFKQFEAIVFSLNEGTRYYSFGGKKENYDIGDKPYKSHCSYFYELRIRKNPIITTNASSTLQGLEHYCDNEKYFCFKSLEHLKSLINRFYKSINQTDNQTNGKTIEIQRQSTAVKRGTRKRGTAIPGAGRRIAIKSRSLGNGKRIIKSKTKT